MLKLYPVWFVFFLVIVVGIGFVLSSDNWFMVWVGFELSLLGFLPMFGVTYMVVEGMIKYFLVQAGGSSLFLISFLMGNSVYAGFLFLLSMVIKLGVFPFYQWVPMVMTSLSWPGCILLSTVQKVAPLFMVTVQSVSFNYLIMLLGCFSVLVSGVLGYNQSYMRSLMGYSSIAHSGWLMVVSIFGSLFVFLYFFIYTYAVVMLFLYFHLYNVLKVVGGAYSFKVWLGMVLLMLTLSGVPPFSLFFMKVMILYFLSQYWFITILLILGSMLSIYYYLLFVIPGLSVYWSGGVFTGGFNMFFWSLFVVFGFPFIFLF